MDLKKQLGQWEEFKTMASRASLKPTLDCQSFDTEKLELILMGDIHLGSRYCAEDLLKENIEYCYENKAPVILMGDQIESATRDSVGAGVYEQEEIIDKQIEHFLFLFKPLAKKGLILGMHPGNHEERLYKNSGLDLAKWMSRLLGVRYFDVGKLHYFRVGREGYLLYTTHGSSGARLPYTKIKGALDLANLADAEIYAMGHLHQLSHHIRKYYEPDLQRKTVKEGTKHFLLTGSYLNHWGSYAHVKNYEPVEKGSPKIKLNGEKHLIRISL